MQHTLLTLVIYAKIFTVFKQSYFQIKEIRALQMGII